MLILKGKVPNIFAVKVPSKVQPKPQNMQTKAEAAETFWSTV